MSYNEYYSRLIAEFENRRDFFPDDFNIGNHRDNKYHLNNSYRGYKIHLVYSGTNSRAFGVDFIGFVVEVYLDGDNYENRFNMLLSHQEGIESSLSYPLTWQSREQTQNQNTCRIFIKKEGNIDDREHWREYIDWQLEFLSKFISVFPQYIYNLDNTVGQNLNEEIFKDYLRVTPSRNGIIPNEARINFLVRMLNKIIPNKLNDFDSTNDNSSLLNIENIEELEKIKRRLNSNGNLNEWNSMNNGQGGASAALHQYINFLEERGTDMTREDFVQKYHAFVDTLPLRNSGRFARLYTGARNSPFKVYKNSQGSIVVLAFTNNASQMVISLNQLLRVVFENERHYYTSYEPILIERIKNNELISSDEIEEENTRLNNVVRNIILYGSPGVGKTYNTKKLIALLESGQTEEDIFKEITQNVRNDGIEAEQIVKNIQDRVQFITFHQSFGYEDFIEGFRPDENGDIKLQNGIFKTICEEAGNDGDNNYYLLIDEINRGNISKIFGELITLIEEDKRDQFEVTLPYSKKPFKIPSNLYIIGTMNSTDKSIALIDIALRRRFIFLKMEPNSELVTYPKAKALFIELNKKIEEKQGKEYMLGHSYFMNIANDSDLSFVLEYKIKPLLEEYFYGESDGYNEIISIIEKGE